MYKCNECNHTFDEPRETAYDRTPYGGLNEPGFEEFVKECPYCAGDYSEAMLCPRCNVDYVSVEDKNIFCTDCQQEIQEVFHNLIVAHFREDEWDYIYDNFDMFPDPFKKEE